MVSIGRVIRFGDVAGRLTGVAFLTEGVWAKDDRFSGCTFAGWKPTPRETAAFGMAVHRQIAARAIGTINAK